VSYQIKSDKTQKKPAGWRRVWEIIKGARPDILDGLVKRILVEEAKYGCIE